MRFLDEHVGLEGTSSHGIYESRSGRQVGVLRYGPTTLDQLRSLRNAYKPVWLLTPSVLCRREALMAIGGFDASFDGAAEDLDLWTRFARHFDVLTLPEPLVCISSGGGALMMPLSGHPGEHASASG